MRTQKENSKGVTQANGHRLYAFSERMNLIAGLEGRRDG